MNWIKKILAIIKSWFSKKEKNQILEVKKSKIVQLQKQEQNFETLNEIILTSNNQDIVLNRINEYVIDENWTTISNNDNNTNFFSQILGATAVTGSAMYAAQGLYRATVSPESLMVYKSGTLSSITMNGKNFSTHAGFVPASATVFTPLLVFQLASMVTGQYYFNGISKQLTTIQQGINLILQNYHNERIAKIKAITNKLLEYEKSIFFTLEDFVNIDKLKMELSIIRYEYLLSANQSLNESLFPRKTNDTTREKFVYKADISTAEELKIKFLEQLDSLSKNIKSLYQDSAAQSTIDKMGSFFENSGKKANTVVEKLNNSKFTFMVEAALEADKLYQYTHFIELKANLSYKNPDENRIGKINQLYKSLNDFNQDKDSIFNDATKTINIVKTEVKNLLVHHKENSFLNETEIAFKEKSIQNQFNTIDRFNTSNTELLNHRKKIQEAFETPIEFVLDNRNGSGKVYIKK